MDPLLSVFAAALEEVRAQDAGAPASYIPELTQIDPDLLAFAVIGPRGRLLSVGDDTAHFTIQSMSKPFVLAMALELIGSEAVWGRVGAEPSGEPFNAISLEAGTGRPANPMVNAGAIATTALVSGDDVSAGSAAIVDMLSRFAGRALHVDESVYASESVTGDRNRALGHLMKSYGVIAGSVDVAVEAYFRQCSTLVTVRDLAVMAGTLAFGGVNPHTGERVVSERTARDVISIMASCGMYDFSGEWLLRVGLPAKSGVSGGVIAVAPSQFGVGAFSPRLDSHGNSVRGSAAVELLSDRLGMHLFEPHEIAQPGIRIDEVDGRRVVRLGGELGLAGMERLVAVLRELAAVTSGDSVILLDASELSRAHPAATEILRAQLEEFAGRIRIEG